MKRRDRSKTRTPDKSGTSAKPKSGWAWTLLAITVVTIAFVASRVMNRSQSRPENPAATGKAEIKTDATESAASDSDKDRALRAEQRQAAEQLLAQFPTNDDVVYLAGLVHNDQGNSEQAMKLWTRSLELDATRADANESLGYALLLRDDYKAAEEYFRRALQIDTNLHSARFRLASALSQDGRLEETVAVLEQAPQLSAEGHRLMAEAFQQLRQLEKSKSHYESAIRFNPNFVEAYYGLSQVLAQLGDTEQSRVFLEKSASLRKESDEEARRARADFNPLAVTKKSVAQTHTDVARVYRMLGETKKAEELWLRAAALDPQNGLCRLQLAVLCHQSRRYREALRFYEEALKLDPADGLAHLNLGNVCLKLNLPERAEQAFKEVIRVAPIRAEGHSALARLYLQANRNLVEAERLAAAAVDLEPEAQYFAVLGEARAKNGDIAGGLNAINRAIALDPANQQYAQTRQQLLGNRK